MLEAGIVRIIEALEDCGYTVLAYHRGRLRVTGLGWRTLGWADAIIQRDKQIKAEAEGWRA